MNITKAIDIWTGATDSSLGYSHASYPAYADLPDNHYAVGFTIYHTKYTHAKYRLISRQSGTGGLAITDAANNVLSACVSGATGWVWYVGAWFTLTGDTVIKMRVYCDSGSLYVSQAKLIIMEQITDSYFKTCEYLAGIVYGGSYAGTGEFESDNFWRFMASRWNIRGGGFVKAIFQVHGYVSAVGTTCRFRLYDVAGGVIATIDITATANAMYTAVVTLIEGHTYRIAADRPAGAGTAWYIGAWVVVPLTGEIKSIETQDIVQRYVYTGATPPAVIITSGKITEPMITEYMRGANSFRVMLSYVTRSSYTSSYTVLQRTDVSGPVNETLTRTSGVPATRYVVYTSSFQNVAQSGVYMATINQLSGRMFMKMAMLVTYNPAQMSLINRGA